MKKLVAVLACLLLLAIAGAALAETFSVAVVYENTVDDKGWCQTMDTGMQRATEVLAAQGVELEYLAAENVAPSDAPNKLEQLADEYDLIIAHGTQFTSAIEEIAPLYPEQAFALGTSDKIMGDNIFTYMPQSEEPGYVNGIIAGLLTKNNTVGIVGPSDSGDAARYVRGFVLGLASVNPEAAENYMISWTDSFVNFVLAGDYATTFIERGCDVLTGPGQQAVGAIRVADSKGVTWVAQTLSQLEDYPNVVAAAADYDYSAVIVTIFSEMHNNGATGGMNIPLNYNNSGYTFTFNSDHPELMPEEVKAQAQAALDALIAEPNTVHYNDVVLK